MDVNNSLLWSAGPGPIPTVDHAQPVLHPLIVLLIPVTILLAILPSLFQKPPQVYAKPRWYPHKDPILGLDVLFDIAQSVYNHRFLTFTADLINRFNGTITYLSLGRQAVYTIDPANIHAMLVDRTHSQDFGLGPTRRQNWKPLFGSGNFNSDGATWKVNIPCFYLSYPN
jgi:hypothetical protein